MKVYQWGCMTSNVGEVLKNLLDESYIIKCDCDKPRYNSLGICKYCGEYKKNIINI